MASGGFLGPAQWSFGRIRSSEEQNRRLRPRPSSNGSLHDQYQAGGIESETPQFQGSRTQSSNQFQPSRAQQSVPNTSADLLSPNGEILERIGREPPPQSENPQSMPVELAADQHYPVELDATENSPSQHRQRPQAPERPIPLQAEADRGNSRHQSRRTEHGPGQFSPAQRNADAARPAAHSEQPRRAQERSPIRDSSPLSHLQRQLRQHPSSQAHGTLAASNPSAQRDDRAGRHQVRSAQPQAQPTSDRRGAHKATPPS